MKDTQKAAGSIQAIAPAKGSSAAPAAKPAASTGGRGGGSSIRNLGRFAHPPKGKR